jgi:hypothetical protein
MKVFVVVALLVAAAAAQSFDYRYGTKEHLLKKLLEKELTGDLVEKKFLRDVEYPTTGLDMIERMPRMNMNVDRVNVVSIEELVNTEIFQEYLELPLFRYILNKHPVAFKRYLESPLFQRFFWTHPRVFKTYFTNEYLFTKYIVPQIELFSVNGVEDIVDRDMETPVFGHKWNLFNKYNMYNKVNKYTTYRPIKHILEQLVRKNLFPLMDIDTENMRGIEGLDFPTYERDVMPWNTHNTELIKYKYILDKIYKHLYNINKPVTEVMTDVKVVEPTKVIDENIIMPETTVGVRDMMLKKLLLNKMRYGKLVGEVETPRELLKDMEIEEMIPRHRYQSMYKTIGNEWTPYKHLFGKSFEKYPIEY